MEELKKAIALLVTEELARANAKFPQFASAHEGYAIIKEEIEEAEEELANINIALSEIWAGTKGNYIEKYEPEEVKVLKKSAINLAAEAVQTAAMAQKFIDMLEREGK